MSHNHVLVGLQLGEDNALFASEEEDKTSQCATSSSDGFENGVGLESDNFHS